MRLLGSALAALAALVALAALAAVAAVGGWEAVPSAPLARPVGSHADWDLAALPLRVPGVRTVRRGSVDERGTNHDYDWFRAVERVPDGWRLLLTEERGRGRLTTIFLVSEIRHQELLLGGLRDCDLSVWADGVQVVRQRVRDWNAAGSPVGPPLGIQGHVSGGFVSHRTIVFQSHLVVELLSPLTEGHARQLQHVHWQLDLVLAAGPVPPGEEPGLAPLDGRLARAFAEWPEEYVADAGVAAPFLRPGLVHSLPVMRWVNGSLGTGDLAEAGPDGTVLFSTQGAGTVAALLLDLEPAGASSRNSLFAVRVKIETDGVVVTDSSLATFFAGLFRPSTEPDDPDRVAMLGLGLGALGGRCYSFLPIPYWRDIVVTVAAAADAGALANTDGPVGVRYAIGLADKVPAAGRSGHLVHRTVDMGQIHSAPMHELVRLDGGWGHVVALAIEVDFPRGLKQDCFREGDLIFVRDHDAVVRSFQSTGFEDHFYSGHLFLNQGSRPLHGTQAPFHHPKAHRMGHTQSFVGPAFWQVGLVEPIRFSQSLSIHLETCHSFWKTKMNDPRTREIAVATSVYAYMGASGAGALQSLGRVEAPWDDGATTVLDEASFLQCCERDAFAPAGTALRLLGDDKAATTVPLGAVPPTCSDYFAVRIVFDAAGTSMDPPAWLAIGTGDGTVLAQAGLLRGQGTLDGRQGLPLSRSDTIRLDGVDVDVYLSGRPRELVLWAEQGSTALLSVEVFCESR